LGAKVQLPAACLQILVDVRKSPKQEILQAALLLEIGAQQAQGQRKPGREAYSKPQRSELGL
jgi:hypothetical protein